MHVGGRELHGQRQAVSIHQEVVLAASFASISRVRASLLAAAFRSDADAVDAGAAPVDSIHSAQPIEHHLVHHRPDADGLPLAQTAPAGHAAAIPQLRRQNRRVHTRRRTVRFRQGRSMAVRRYQLWRRGLGVSHTEQMAVAALGTTLIVTEPSRSTDRLAIRQRSVPTSRSSVFGRTLLQASLRAI
jgi:hypothetical protein